MEFAYVWQAYGAQITVVEMLPQVLPLEDEEVSAEVAKAFKKMKVNVMTATRTEGAERTDDGVRVRVKNIDSGQEETLEAELVLIATGVRPNSEDLGLETVVGLREGLRRCVEHYRAARHRSEPARPRAVPALA